MDNEDMTLPSCIVCDSDANYTDDRRTSLKPRILMKRVECPKCGIYSISYDLLFSPAQPYWENRVRLSKALRLASDRGNPAYLGTPKDIVKTFSDLDRAEHAAGPRTSGR